MQTSVADEIEAEGSIGVGLLMALGLLSAAGPLAMDFYLASLPDVETSLHTSATLTQFTITAFLLGLGGGQLLWGPVSDRYGRRRPLLIGCVISLIASLGAVLAPSIGLLIAARFLQALGASAGVTMSRAVIADRARGRAAAHAMSVMMSITSVAPVVAPLVGGVLASAGVSWRWVLTVVLVAMVAQLIAALAVVDESLPVARRSTRIEFVHLGKLLRRHEFIWYAVTAMFGFGAFMAYVSSSSFVYQRVIGTSGAVYGVGFAVNACGMISASLISARLIRRGADPARIVARSLPVMLSAALLVLVIAATPAPKALLALAFLTAATAMGFMMGNTAALAIGAAREVAGSASGVLGASNFLFGGLVSSLGGLAGSGTAVPLGIVMAASAVGAIVSFGLVRRR